jgi:diguanylate cyclase (GGDEF)-like protein
MQPKTTEQVRKTIQRYVAGAIIIVATLIASITIYPLYHQMRQMERSTLDYARGTARLVTNEYIDRILELARHIASKPQKHWQEALAQSQTLIGLQHLDNNGKLISSFGHPAHPPTVPTTQQQKQQRIYGPIIENQQYFLAVIPPTLDKAGQKYGSDIATFSMHRLQKNLHSQLKHRLGELVLAYIAQGQIHTITPTQDGWHADLNTNKALQQTLRLAIQDKQEGNLSTQVANNDVFIAFAPINHSPIGIAVIIRANVLFAPIQAMLWHVLLIIAVIILLVLYGLKRCLKPYAGQLIMHTHELEKQINDSQAALKKANEQLTQLATCDPLTKALNRRGFNEALNKALAHAKRHQQGLTLLYLDINQFKHINDTLGHEAGDCVLKHVSQMINQHIRKEDSAARLGGDEFAIVMPDFTSTHLAALQEKILDITQHAIEYDGHSICINLSLGHACYPEDGQTSDALLKLADLRMYQQKRQGSDRTELS